MPLYFGDDALEFNMVLLRHYLRTSRVQCGEDVLQDAFLGRETGAVELLRLCLSLRGNVRTRRRVPVVWQEWRRATGPGTPPPPRWYRVLCTHLFGVYRQFNRICLPIGSHHSSTALTHRLSRSLRRTFGYTGTVQVNLPTLREQATEATRCLWQELAGQHAVVWVDNWYWERYSTNPAAAVLSQDLTAYGVLLLSSTSQGPAQGTRSHRPSSFNGHLTLHQLTCRLPTAAHTVMEASAKLIRHVARLIRRPLQAHEIRVPLDIPRPSRRSLQWRGLTLSQHRVSSAPELFMVLKDLVQLQQHVGQVMPLMVDEKIHYSVCRLLYSRTFVEYDVGQWLDHIPLLYGVWHPYKQSLHLLYRAFLPILGLLECTGVPRLGQRVPCQRKVLYLEKLFGALLLAAGPLRDQVQSALRRSDGGVTQGSADCT